MFLERAKGPSAKVELAWSWFSEFMTREDLAGSFGGIGAPIISNIHASLSEGMAHYNHCRKIVFMPFPFPHAQISAAFIITVMIIIPLLLEEYMRSTIVGGIITFLSVTCLAGLHEVARDLENPFENIPNEIPLTVLQAMFNDSLITVFAGFHPDHYWNADDFRRSSSNMKSQ
jgi:predicted membrane chloride channel (bestrophin family)